VPPPEPTDARDETARQEHLVAAGDKLDDGADGEDEGQEYDAAFSTHEVGQEARGERADDAAQ